MGQYKMTVEDCTVQEFPNFNAFFTRQRKSYEDKTAENGLPGVQIPS